MIADTIRFVLTNLPLLLFIAALIIATVSRGIPGTAERYLAWLLLLSIGAAWIWAGFFHVFFPAIAAAAIGWHVSPFQFEIGVADLSIGIAAVISFWRGFEFKSAVVIYIVLFNVGVAIGHVRQALWAGDFSPDNFGVLLVITVVQAVLLPALFLAARRNAQQHPAL